MESSEDKQWATKYLLDPLTEPDPSHETGPGTHLGSTFAPNTTPKSSSQLQEEKKQASSRVKDLGTYPTPPQSASPSQSRFPNASVNGRESTEIPISTSRPSVEENHAGRSRGLSLPERYAGDDSPRPLDIVRRESKKAHRSPHLRKDRHHGVDSIDQLAAVEKPFHHEGPYDAASLARNMKHKDSPIAALKTSNAEALKATPRENVMDAIKHHRPLDGVAQIPPGMPDRIGRVYDYKEGQDMQQGTGEDTLNHWSGLVDYHPDDRAGKGEPSYSVEQALKQHKHGRHSSEGFEMASRPRHSSGDAGIRTRNRAVSGADRATGTDQSYAEWESGLRRSNSGRMANLKNKLGSLRRRNHVPTEE